MPLPSFPDRPDLIGVGLSDWDGYAIPLAAKLRYRNTFYHVDPHLDITAPPSTFHGTLDFLISSDVFEHIPSPVFRAFEGAAALLRPGGVMIFTAPCMASARRTLEFYPDIVDFRVVEIGGHHCVVTKDWKGTIMLDQNPVFHGGPGQTLAFRIFGQPDLVRYLEEAGFCDIKIMKNPVPEFGIFYDSPDDLPLVARKA